MDDGLMERELRPKIKALFATMVPSLDVIVESSDYGFRLGVGITHPNGGQAAVQFIKKQGTSLADTVEAHVRRHRHSMVARAEWAHVPAPTRWQKLTMQFRPKYRLQLTMKQIAMNDAASKDARGA